MEGEVSLSLTVESVRRVIAWTSGVAGVRRLYAGVYHAAARKLVQEVSSLEGVLSVLTRNSYAAGTFTPGLSDIDVVVVIRDKLEVPAVNSLLNTLNLICRSLRRQFPMLNPFPVYTRKGFIMAYRLGPLRIESDVWQCEWGDDQILSILREPQRRPPLEVVTRGVQIYLRGFHGSLRASLLAGKTRSTLALERSAKKVIRALGSADPLAGPRSKGPIPDVIAGILMASNLTLDGLKEEHAPHSWDTIGSGDKRLPDVNRLPGNLSEGIASIITRKNGSTPSYILSLPVSVSAVENALGMVRLQDAGPTGISFVTEPLFSFFLRHINPMAYYRLQAARIVRGSDVFERIRPPSEAGVRRFFCYEAAHLLRLPIQLGSGQSAPQRAMTAHRRRRERLFHFMQHKEILLDNHPSLSSSSQPEQTGTLSDLMIADMPGILQRLNDRPTELFCIESGNAC